MSTPLDRDFILSVINSTNEFSYLKNDEIHLIDKTLIENKKNPQDIFPQKSLELFISSSMNALNLPIFNKKFTDKVLDISDHLLEEIQNADLSTELIDKIKELNEVALIKKEKIDNFQKMLDPKRNQVKFQNLTDTNVINSLITSIKSLKSEEEILTVLSIIDSSIECWLERIPNQTKKNNHQKTKAEKIIDLVNQVYFESILIANLKYAANNEALQKKYLQQLYQRNF